VDLLLDDVPAWLWERFHEHARRVEVPRGFAPVIERWRRAESLGAPADGAPVDAHLLRGESLRAHEQRAGALAAAAERTLIEAQGFVAARGYLLLLADPDGGWSRPAAAATSPTRPAGCALIEGAARAGPAAPMPSAPRYRRPVDCGAATPIRPQPAPGVMPRPSTAPAAIRSASPDATSTIERADEVVGSPSPPPPAPSRRHAPGAYAAPAPRWPGPWARPSIAGGAVLLLELPGRIARANLPPSPGWAAGDGGRARAVLGLGGTSCGARRRSRPRADGACA
jgi:hypothetical protein